MLHVLLAYIDEIGEPGAFVERSHDRYNTSVVLPQELVA
jgi:hypothetical protein